MAAASPRSAVQLLVEEHVALEPSRACAILAFEPDRWLGPPLDHAPKGMRRYHTDLTLSVREQAPELVLRKSAYVDIGPVQALDGGCRIEIGWRSATLAPLFPVFSGHLTATASGLRLVGYYAPPGGEIGVVLDRAVLGIAARATARRLLKRLAAALADRS